MQKTILYAVLNWGLGHATRSIPIIQHLLETGNKLVIASDGDALHLLQKEFPTLIFEKVSAYNVHYASSAATFNFTLAKQIPKFLKTIKNEHQECEVLCKKHEIDFIISDNRYGFYHNKIPCALICHQLHLLYEDNLFFEKIINKSYQKFLKNFTKLWVPDFEKPNSISGKLSSLQRSNVQFIGAESRFDKMKIKKTFSLLAILSGPEPQRTLLENKLLKQLTQIEGQHCLIRGTINAKKLPQIENITVIDFATSQLLNQKIEASEMVICRSGYTSVIDLLKLNKKALLIPTPGQIEQEYLAKNLKAKNCFSITNQAHLNLKMDLKAVKEIEFPDLEFKYNFEIIQQFLSFPI